MSKTLSVTCIMGIILAGNLPFAMMRPFDPLLAFHCTAIGIGIGLSIAVIVS